MVFTTNPACWVEALLYGGMWGLMLGSLVGGTLVPQFADNRRTLISIGILTSSVAFALLFAVYATYRDRRRLHLLENCMSQGVPAVCQVVSVTPAGALPEFPTKQLTIAVARTLQGASTVFEYRYHCAGSPNLAVGDQVLFCYLPASNAAVFVRTVYLCLVNAERRRELSGLLSTCKNETFCYLGFEKITVLSK